MRVTPKKKLAKKKACSEKGGGENEGSRQEDYQTENGGAHSRKQVREKSQSVDTVAFGLEGLGPHSGEQSGDLQGLSNVEGADFGECGRVAGGRKTRSRPMW